MKKVGLALGSGGVRGLAHIGVIKTLLKNNIPIDFIAGCSIGSWVGAHYCLYRDIKTLEEITVGKRKEKFFSFIEPSISGGFIKGDKLEKLLNEWLKYANFEDLKIPLRVVATDLVKGEEVIFDKGPVAFAVRASMGVPGIFAPVKFEGKVLVDGGVSDPVPDKIVKKLGAEIIISVNLDNVQNEKPSNEKYSGFQDVALRSLEIMRQYLAKDSMRDSDFIIQPPLRDYSSWLDYFTKNEGAEIVKIGEKEAEKIIPELKKKLGL
ncbi:MAG: patatin-like phospholipase family protein [Candidatus Gracilibacteria bacterium]|jgi:NTE family protein